MTALNTYGMAGIGIAAAIGFVFALSLLSNNNNSSSNQGANLVQQQQQQPTPPHSPSISSPLMKKQAQQPFSDSGRQENLSEAKNDTTPPSTQAGQAGNSGSGTVAGRAQGMEAAITPRTNNKSMTNNSHNSSSSNQQDNNTTTTTNMHPVLTSLVMLNSSNSETIGEIKPQTELKLGKPVLIQANFKNNDNETEIILQHTFGMSIKNQQNRDESFVNLKSDIARGSNIAITMYWEPNKIGEYTIVIFSMSPDDLSSTFPATPVATIPVKVAQ